MKWIWNWYDPTQDWWKLPSQMTTANGRPWDSLHSTRFWKNMHNVLPEFASSVTYQIGDGKTTLFWHDRWRGTPLRYVYPNLYELVQNKNETVHQCLTVTMWLSQFQSLTPLAQLEKDRLIMDLHTFPLNQDPDSLIWTRSSTGFTVASAYHFLSHTPTPTTDLKHIWSIKAPLRVRVFIWLMLTNRLPTTDNLAKRGWLLPSMCVLCRRNEETIPHIFQHCTFAKELRDYVHSTLPPYQTLSHRFKTDLSFQVLTDLLESQHARQWELVFCFIVWRERCRRVFSDRTDSLMAIVREMRTEYKCWFQ